MTDPADLPPLTYLSTDSVVEGVGASQVLPYLAGLGDRGVKVRLHSFEPSAGTAERAKVSRTGVLWHPHRFGSAGSAGGLSRVARGAAAIARAELVHARSDMAAASALVGHPRRWVWDVRSFWVDQRIALGMVSPGSRVEKVMRAVERRAAARSAAIITLTDAAIEELGRRHGSKVADRATRITTCVDLDRFALAPMPEREPRLLISGSANSLYDHALMVEFASTFKARHGGQLLFLRPTPGPWDESVLSAGGRVDSIAFADMPAAVRDSHAGLCFFTPVESAALSGAMPTKVGELLASGRPVVATPGVGDLDSLVRDHCVGMIIDERDERALERAAGQLAELLRDDDLPSRCRRLAESHFSLDAGVSRLLDVYRAAI